MSGRLWEVLRGFGRRELVCCDPFAGNKTGSPTLKISQQLSKNPINSHEQHLLNQSSSSVPRDFALASLGHNIAPAVKKLSYPHSHQRALHFCRRQKLHIAQQCFTTDAIRRFTLVCVPQTNTCCPPPIRSSSPLFLLRSEDCAENDGTTDKFAH